MTDQIDYTADACVLIDDSVIDWFDQPAQFRHAVDKKRAKRFVRNADTARLHFPALGGDVIAQKTDLLAQLDKADDDDLIALVFNGLDCLVCGIIAQGVFIAEDDDAKLSQLADEREDSPEVDADFDMEGDA